MTERGSLVWRRHAVPLLGLALAAVTGCASPMNGTVSPAAAIRGDATLPAGRYTGIITGREMATASSLSTIRAQLTIEPDGRWTMRTDNGVATGRIERAGPDALVLSGHFEDSARSEGRPAHYRLAPTHDGDALAGSALAYHGGHTVWAGIQLEREN